MRARAVIFEEGKPCEELHIVAAGVIALYKSAPDKTTQLLQFAFPGDVLDWRVLSPLSRHSATATCLSESSICVMPAAALRKAVAAGGPGAVAIARQVAEQLEGDRNLQMWRSSVSGRQRLLQTLWQLVRHQGRRQCDGSWFFELPVTRRDLASLIYTRPETISRLLKTLEDEDLAYFDGRHVVIPDIEALQRGDAIEQPEAAFSYAAKSDGRHAGPDGP